MQEGAYAQLLSVLAAVLEHPVLASDQLLLCSAARVCGSWRAAVAASGAGTTDIVLRKAANTYDDDETASSFALWLTKHAHLARSLQLADGKVGAFAADYLARWMRQGQDFHLARLQSFSLCVLDNTALLLRALPDSLTKLDVRIDENSEASTYKEVQHALQRLQHLRVLKLEVDSEHSDDTKNLDVSCVSELCCLTQLELSVDLDEDEWGMLGQALLHLTGLQELALKCVDWHNTREPMSLQLAPLTALQKLSITVVSDMLGHDLWQLPRQLSSLQLDLGCLDMNPRSIQEKHCPMRSLGLGNLAHLRTLKVKMAAHHLLAWYSRGITAADAGHHPRPGVYHSVSCAP